MISQFHGPALPRGFEAGVRDFLRFCGPHGPVVIQFAGCNLIRKVSPHEGIMRGGVTLHGRVRTRGTFDRAADGDDLPVHLKRRLIAVIRMDEIRQV